MQEPSRWQSEGNGNIATELRCALFIALLLAAPSVLQANDLNQETVKVWDAYIQQTNLRMQQRLAGSTFLWIDEAPGRRERVRQGEVLVEPANENSPKKAPQGLIHDWLGAVFIPDATIESVFAMLNDYGQYPLFYKPAVLHAALLDDSGETRKFSLLLHEKAPFVNAAISSDYISKTIRVDDQHWYNITYSTRIQQIENYGESGERVLPPDTGAGFIWRLYSIQRFEARDGGVYTELEAIGLSRDVPFELKWLAGPIVHHLPRNSITATLQKTRDAVCAEASSRAGKEAKPAPSNANSSAHDPMVVNQRGLENHKIPTARSLGLQPQN